MKLSLGVDVLPKNKLCSYDCVYCEIGPTGRSQLVSPEFRIQSPPTAAFRKELRSILPYVPHLNSITFGYNGEPTLNENLTDFLEIAKDVREEVKWTENQPLMTLFTNSSTIHFKEVRERVIQFDLVLAKLDAATVDDFKRSNRPHEKTPDIGIIVDSLSELKSMMPKDHKLAIQCLLFNSYKKDFPANYNKENIEKIGEALKKIKPDIVQLYSIARIPAQYYVFAIDEDQKKQAANRFKEIINDSQISVNYY